MAEIEAYAEARGLHPSTIVQRAGCGSGKTWAKWQAGGACLMHTADRLRRWMAENPVSEADGENAA